MTVSETVVYELEPFGARVEPARPGAPMTDLSIDQLRELVRKNHLLLLRGFQPFGTAEQLAEYCAQWGEISLWPFGAVLELVEHENPEDHIFDHSYVPLHWDGMYREHVPEFQIFHCVNAPGARDGGRTTFTQTESVLRDVDLETRALWESVTGIYRRKMEFYDSKAISPVVTSHPDRGFPVIRYGEPAVKDDANFINHPNLEFTGVQEPELTRFHQTMRAALYSPKHYYAHAWQTGDLVVADNYTLLHGRESFTRRARRHLRRVHILGDPPLVNPALIR